MIIMTEKTEASVARKMAEYTFRLVIAWSTSATTAVTHSAAHSASITVGMCADGSLLVSPTMLAASDVLLMVTWTRNSTTLYEPSVAMS